MDGLQRQIIDLTCKVDTLSQMVEQLSSQLKELLSEKQQKILEEKEQLPAITQMQPYSRSTGLGIEATMEHKDILVDNSSWGNNTEQNYESTMSPETQIRRLTAQLTAAYNRIAALEEQLLARRIHS